MAIQIEVGGTLIDPGEHYRFSILFVQNKDEQSCFPVLYHDGKRVASQPWQVVMDASGVADPPGQWSTNQA